MSKAFTFSDTTGTINLASQRGIMEPDSGHMVVGLYPATSNTCVVEVTLEPDPTDGAAVWHAWDLGAVTSASISGLWAFPTGIRARRTVGSAGGNRLIVQPLE